MDLSLGRKYLLLGGAAFVALLGIAVAFEQYWFFAVPAALMVIWAAFFRLDYLFLFITFCVPFSLNLEQLDIDGIGLYLPTEPLLFGVMLIVIFKMLTGKSVDRKIYSHPVSKIIYVYLGLIFITSVTSELPLVSFKFLVSKLWFILPCYFVASHIFKNPGHIRKFWLLYLFPLFGVIIYTVIRHAGFGFEKEAGHWVMEPFFKDHTSYGAALAMMVPPMIYFLISRKTNLLLRVVLLIGAAILIAGTIFSYTRAAWLSLAAAAVVMIFMLLRVPFRYLMGVLVFLLGFVWLAQDDLLILLEKNSQDSSDNLTEHVESMSNISTDASNLERLNRWNCAIEMFKERPLTGWGPGTYQFVYAPFQRSQDLTIISTNNADGGNAHSDYLGPLSEQGIFGPIIYLLLILYVSYLAFKLFYKLKDPDLRMIVICSYLGLFTYFVHGVLNNYLDTDKISVLFWGGIAILVSIDIYTEGRSDLLGSESF